MEARTGRPDPGRGEPRLRVLFVDDEPDILTAVEDVLRVLDPSVEFDAASSGEEALAKLAARGGYQAVVSDERMPGMPGVELLRRVRAAYPGAVCILVSAYGDDRERRRAATAAGADAFLPKPFDVRDLLRQIHAARKSRGDA